MKVLVTRPKEDALAFAEELEALGYDAVVQPLLRVRNLKSEDSAFDPRGLQGLLFTSANGVRAFCRFSNLRDIQVFAVGASTAKLAEDSGFEHVRSAGGDLRALADLVIETLDPNAGRLFHGAAKHLAGNLQGMLERAGFQVEKRVLYRTEVLDSLPESLCRDLAKGKIGAVTLFSPRTAKCFASLLEKAGIVEAARKMEAICLSEAVAREIGKLRWGAVRVAERPDKDSLIDCLPRK
ncbi:MAG: uroporphyrinogen-III synthase [Kiloniellales bacterium]|nr:uroporphyrinogen-III synthase [Kiloniellales bacterium]